MSESTLNDYLASQDSLVQEAALALPHSFAHCTYDLGYIRQPIYLCYTCNSVHGVCAACSIACHTNHEQLELFPKRNFRCDCPTTTLANPCTLHSAPQLPNNANQYGQNFKGKFCRCGRDYNAFKERETMIQCLACEDWYHESCLNLRERPSSREPTPQPVRTEPEPNKEDNNSGDGNGPETNEDGDETASTSSSSGLPPPLITSNDYEALVCATCVARLSVVRRYAGTPGALLVVRADDGWQVLGRECQDQGDVKVDGCEVGSKRGREGEGEVLVEGHEAKRARGEGPSDAWVGCLAPPTPAFAQDVFEGRVESTLDVFLTEGFRERWCHCPSCLPCLEANPYLLTEEDTYEPPADPDSGLSLEELGMRALRHVPRDRAIDGIRAFNTMRDELVEFLRPFGREGKVVGEQDVRAFFERFRQSE